MKAQLAKSFTLRQNPLYLAIGLFAILVQTAIAAIGAAPQSQQSKTERQEKQPEEKQKETAEKRSKDTSVRTEMRNVSFRFADNISVQIKSLTGALVPVGEHDMPVMDDKNSFKIRVDSADMQIYPKDLENILNSYVFARPKSPLGSISIVIEKGQLRIKGRLRDKGNIPFETIGTLTATSDGRVRLHGEKIRALHVPVKGLMEAFGIEIDDLIKNGKVAGVSAEENDLILDLQQVLPPPHIEGGVTAIGVEGNALATTFGKAPAKRLSNAPPNGNFMAYEGNRMKFEKLTMDNVDMILLDLDPADPLDFFLEHYTEQVAAGYSKISRSFQLRVYLRDYEKLHRQLPPKSKAPTN